MSEGLIAIILLGVFSITMIVVTVVTKKKKSFCTKSKIAIIFLIVAILINVGALGVGVSDNYKDTNYNYVYYTAYAREMRQQYNNSEDDLSGVVKEFMEVVAETEAKEAEEIAKRYEKDYYAYKFLFTLTKSISAALWLIAIILIIISNKKKKKRSLDKIDMKCQPAIEGNSLGEETVTSLRELKRLLDEEIITEEEYATKKKQILKINI